MEAIEALIRQLEESEAHMHLERRDVLQRRTQEDEERRRTRIAEDDLWKQRFNERDQEEDDLRRQRRELVRGSLKWTSSFANDPTTSRSEASRVYQGVITLSSNRRSMSTNDEVQPASTPQPTNAGERLRERKPRSSTPRKPFVAQKSRPCFGWPDNYDEHRRPLYTRPSDGRLVHLYCCIDGCPKAHFSNMQACLTHLSSKKHHGLGPGFFRDQAHAIESCGRLPMGEDDYDGAETGMLAARILPTAQPHDDGSGSPIPISALRRSTRAQRLNSNAPTQHNSDLSYLDAGMKMPGAQSLAKTPSTHSRLTVGRQDISTQMDVERVQVPAYVTKMRYDPDEDEEGGTDLMIPEVDDGNGGTSSRVRAGLEGQVKAENEAVLSATNDNPQPLDHEANSVPTVTADERATYLPLFLTGSSPDNLSVSELNGTAKAPSILRQFPRRPTHEFAPRKLDQQGISQTSAAQHSSFVFEDLLPLNGKRASSVPLAMLDPSGRKRRPRPRSLRL